MHRYNLFGTPAKSRGFQMSTEAASFHRRKLAAEITFMCYNMDAKNNTGSAVLAVEPCSFIHRGNRSGPAL